MLIFVEGPDGSGKTTLIEEFVKKVPCVTVKYPKEVKKTYELIRHLACSNQTVIFDRSFISDLVYRMWDHKKGQMTLSEIGDVLNWNVFIIFCKNKKSYENSIARGEDFITDEDTHKIIECNYSKVQTLIESFTDAKTFNYDFNHMYVDDVIEYMKAEGLLNVH